MEVIVIVEVFEDTLLHSNHNWMKYMEKVNGYGDNDDSYDDDDDDENDNDDDCDKYTG
jgi:hypothetical protein